MPDPTLPPLPPGFTLDTPQAAPGGSMVVGTPRPPKPEVIPGSKGQTFGPGGVAQDIPGFKPQSESAQHWRQLTEGDGKLYLPDRPGLINEVTGEVKYGPAPAKGTTSASAQADQAAALLRAAGVDLEKGIDPIAPLIQNSTSGRIQHLGAEAYGGITGHATSGMKNITKLQTIVSDMVLSLTGGGLGNQISNADREFIAQRVGNLADPNVPADARLAAWEQVKNRMANLTGVKRQDHAAGLAGAAPEQPPADVNPIANNTPGDQGPQLTPSADGYRTVIDPKKQALGEKIAALVSKGADRNTVMGFAVGADPTLRNDPRFAGWVDQALKYRKQHPKAQFPINSVFYTTRVPLSQSEQLHNDAAQSAPVAAGTNAVDAFSAGNLANIAGALGGDAGKVEQALAVQAQQHPGASLAGTMLGGVGAGLTGEAALAKLGMSSGVPRAIASDLAYGGAAGATNSDDPLTGGIKGALASAGGGLAGNALTRGISRSLEGVTNPTVSYVAKEIPDRLTLGQAVSQSGPVGRVVKRVEDSLSGIPVVGDAVNARRLEGLQKMNARAFDKALEPIGGNGGGQFGEQAVADAQDKISQAFQRALSGKSVSLDRPFIREAAAGMRSVQSLPPRVAGEVEDSIDAAIANYFDPATKNLTGENMQPLLRELDGIKRAYANDPLGHRIGKAVDQVSDSVENLFRRQSPDVMPQYDAAKQAFKRLSTLEDAVLRAKNTNGVFTPAQLGMADRANTVKYGGKHAAAAGKSEFHDFQRNMQEVLPNKVPDSGTSGRVLLPLAVVGLGAGGGAAAGDTGTGTAAGLTLAGLLSLAYSKYGQSVLRNAVLERGNLDRAAGRAVRKSSQAVGHGTGAASALGVSRE